MADSICLTVEEAAAELKISRSLCYAMIKAGRLPPAIRISTRRWVINKKALQEWLDDKTRAALQGG